MDENIHEAVENISIIKGVIIGRANPLLHSVKYLFAGDYFLLRTV